MSKFIFTFLAMALFTLSSPAWSDHVWRDGEFRGTVILTVTGNVTYPTRSGSSEEVDKFFLFNDVTFENAAQFDVAALQALPQASIRADFPKNGEVYTYEGPLLRDTLEAVGAVGETVTIRALDGYAVEIPLSEAYERGAVVALRRDEIPFAIGDFGPIHVVFPRADRADLVDMSDDWWVWSVYHINVE